MKRRKSWRARERVEALLGLALVLAAGPAAAQVGPVATQNVFFNQAANARAGSYLHAFAGAVYTDNATLTPSGTADVLALLGLSANTGRVGPRLDYGLTANISVVRYLKDSYTTRPSGYLDGVANYRIVPGVFSWYARDTYNQILINAGQPGTPNNLESLNNFSTGPRLAWAATLQTTLTVQALYSWINSTSTSGNHVNLDSQQYQVTAELAHAFSSSSSIYLGASTDKVKYKVNVTGTDYTLDEAFGGYRFSNRRTVVDLEGTYAKVKIDTLTSNYGTYSVNLSRVISPRQRVSFLALQQVTDSSNLFRLNLDQPVVGPAPIGVATAGAFVYRQFGFDWRFQGRRNSFDLGFIEFRDRYIVTTAANLEGKTVNALFARQLNPHLNFDIGAAFQHQDLSAGFYRNQVFGLTDLYWQVGRLLAVRFFYAHTTSTPSPDGYLANQVGLIVTYGGGGAGAGAVAGLLPTSGFSTQSRRGGLQLPP